MFNLEPDTYIRQIHYTILDDLWESPQDQQLVLDLGCGDGHYLVELAEHYVSAIGLDIDGEALSYTRTYEAFPPNVFLIQGDALQLPMRAESISAVLASGLLCQRPLANMLDLLEEMARVLKPGGTLVIGLCNPLQPIPESFPKFGDGPSLPIYKHVCSSLHKHGLDWHIRSESPECFWTIGAVKKHPVPKDSGTDLIAR